MWLSALWLLSIIILFAKGYKKEALTLLLIGVMIFVVYILIFIIRPWSLTGCIQLFLNV